MKACLGLLTVELHFDHSGSLKERRSIMSSLKSRLRSRFNASVAEADYGDAWQRGGLIVSCAGTHPNIVEQALRDIAAFIDQDPRVIVIEPSIRFYE
jgi:uncharacterized protein